MHWSLFVLLGGTLNAFTNYGYKVRSTQPGPLVFAGMVFAISAVALTVYAAVKGFGDVQALLAPKPLLLALAMGIATAGVITAMMRAFGQAGPISLVDPMWACVYSLSSVLLGLLVAGEEPSGWALGGIGLYLAGAFLMANGNRT